jgi:hypothetical protein
VKRERVTKNQIQTNGLVYKRIALSAEASFVLFFLFICISERLSDEVII